MCGTSFRDALKRYHDDAENFWYRRYHPYFACEIDLAHMRLWELHIYQIEIATIKALCDRYSSAVQEQPAFVKK